MHNDKAEQKKSQQKERKKSEKKPKSVDHKLLIYGSMVQMGEGAILTIPSVDCPENPNGESVWLNRCFECRFYGGRSYEHVTYCKSSKFKSVQETSENPKEDYVAGAIGGKRLAGEDIPPMPPEHESALLKLKIEGEKKNVNDRKGNGGPGTNEGT